MKVQQGLKAANMSSMKEIHQQLKMAHMRSTNKRLEKDLEKTRCVGEIPGLTRSFHHIHDDVPL